MLRRRMKQSCIPVVFVLIVAIAGLLMCTGLTRGHNWGDDFAAYIMQAESITEAMPRAFVDANRFTVEQSSRPIGPVAYPWGFPVALAPLYAIFGLNLMALKSVGVISYLLFLASLWPAFRRVHTGSWFLCLVCLFALNPTLLDFSNNIASDLPFLVVSTLCISLIREVVVHDRCIIPRLEVWLIGAGIVAAFVLRTNGVLLLVTLGLSQLVSYLRKKCHDGQPQPTNVACGRSAEGSDLLGRFSTIIVARPLAPYIVFFCSVTIWNWILPYGGMSHVSSLGSISLRTTIRNLYYYVELPSTFFSGAPHQTLLYGATVPLAVAGAARRYRSDYPTLIYVTLTLVLYICWPEREGIRFLFPILPFYVSFTFSSLQDFCGSASAVERGLRKTVCYVPILLVIFFFGMTALRAIYFNNSSNVKIAHGPFARTSQEMFSFVKNNTEVDSIMIFFKPRLMRLMTSRQSIMVNRIEQLSRGDYLCLYLRKEAYHQVSDGEVERLLAQGIVRLVYVNDDFKVYRLIKVA